MRYAILADIHANLTAFEAVLCDIEKQGGVAGIWCLGDIVGYGPDPSECIALLRGKNHLCVAGNHDWAAIGKLEMSEFNPDAAAACRWTASQLSPEDVNYLDSLPITVRRNDFTIVHGSPREPIWEYILSASMAYANLGHFDTAYCLVGHSHLPVVFEDAGDTAVVRGIPTTLKLGIARLIINPGSVGQPRDGDPRASYAIYNHDERTICHRRVPYNIEETQERMVQKDLPGFLVERLSYGR